MNHPFHKIVLFGDSITQMSFDPTLFGFGANLANAYQRKADVVNRGFSGYNTEWALPVLHQLLPTVEEQEQHASSILLMTIFFGANDAALPFAFQHIPRDNFIANLHAMLDCINDKKSKYYNPKIRLILVTPPPLNEAMWEKCCQENDEPLNRSWDSAKSYADAVKEVGKARNVPVADIWTELSSLDNGDFSNYTFDGLHLNDKGNMVAHKLLMETISKEYKDIHPDELEMELPGFREFQNMAKDGMNKQLQFPLLSKSSSN